MFSTKLTPLISSLTVAYIAMTRPRRKTLVIASIIVLWIIAMLVALWWYQARFIRPFSESTAIFSGQELQLPPSLAGAGAVRLVHFWEPACPCNVGNQQHLAEMMEEFKGKVEFYHLQKPNTKGQLPPILNQMNHLAGLPGAEQLPASPAVAIWDQSGQLAYFGPYSEGAVCNSSNSFIEPILNALLEGRSVAASNTLAVGCFCDWQTPDT